MKRKPGVGSALERATSEGRHLKCVRIAGVKLYHGAKCSACGCLIDVGSGEGADMIEIVTETEAGWTRCVGFCVMCIESGVVIQRDGSWGSMGTLDTPRF